MITFDYGWKVLRERNKLKKKRIGQLKERNKKKRSNTETWIFLGLEKAIFLSLSLDIEKLRKVGSDKNQIKGMTISIDIIISEWIKVSWT